MFLLPLLSLAVTRGGWSSSSASEYVKRNRFLASLFPIAQAMLESAGKGCSKAADRAMACTGKEALGWRGQW